MEARAQVGGLAEHAGIVVGIDPHKRTQSATIVDQRGGLMSRAHFRLWGAFIRFRS